MSTGALAKHQRFTESVSGSARTVGGVLLRELWSSRAQPQKILAGGSGAVPPLKLEVRKQRTSRFIVKLLYRSDAVTSSTCFQVKEQICMLTGLRFDGSHHSECYFPY